ncbi:MAG: hypothetical protein WA184_20805, partial [Stellaceae bacterium]
SQLVAQNAFDENLTQPGKTRIAIGAVVAEQIEDVRPGPTPRRWSSTLGGLDVRLVEIYR